MVVIDSGLQERIDQGSLSPVDLAKLALVYAADREGVTVYSAAKGEEPGDAVVVSFAQASCRSLLGSVSRWEFSAVLEFLPQNPDDVDGCEREMQRLIEALGHPKYGGEEFAVKSRRGERVSSGVRLFCRMVLDLIPEEGGEAGVMRMLEQTVGN